MTRNPITVTTPAGTVTVTKLTSPSPAQAAAFELIGAKIPDKITYPAGRG
ncbi:MAG: hypothetical protein LBG60_16735 [Bifidobacteriaceae bacterium]|jgi:hypothetical protein|nr:hypothetical protein [Bifidobacteriaceae bacterium]